MSKSRLVIHAAAIGLFGVAAARPASAASIIKDPNPPQYKVEIEPHLNLQFFGFDYDARGFGPGVRFSIPVMSPGFIKRLNNSVAISFGADLMYYSPRSRFCRGGGRDFECYEPRSFWALYAPVAMQWNFWLTDKWSVFGEPGLVVRTPVSSCDAFYGCDRGSWVYPAFFAGGRFHFSDRASLTMRIGFPHGLTVGVSFFP
jgi:hypothetical protein